jgi:hypothetical protein
MSEPARSFAPDADDHARPGLFTKLKRWLAPEIAEAEAVRDVIEELIEERIEDRPEGEAAIDPNERLLLANVLKLRGVTAADMPTSWCRAPTSSRWRPRRPSRTPWRWW